MNGHLLFGFACTRCTAHIKKSVRRIDDITIRSVEGVKACGWCEAQTAEIKKILLLLELLGKAQT